LVIHIGGAPIQRNASDKRSGEDDGHKDGN
jgi:hypothetical protein